MKLGDAISTVATPIAAKLGLDCVDEQGQLKPESPCGQRKAAANNWGSAVWDYLFSNNKQERTSMDYIVTKQIKVEANDVEGALKAAIEGKGTTIGMNANPRPTPPAQPARPTAGVGNVGGLGGKLTA